MNAAVTFEKVEKRFGGATALAGLTLDVRRGEMFGLIGPDGAGKTTAIRLLCGLLHSDAGTVRVFDRDYKNPKIFTVNLGYEREVRPSMAAYVDFTVARGMQ